MSNVAFHSPDRDAVRVGGAERVWTGLLCTRLMHGVLGLDDFPSLDRPPLDRLLRMVPGDHYVHDSARRAGAEGAARSLRMALGGYDDCLTWNGHHVNEFTLALNTALVVGGDARRMRYLAEIVEDKPYPTREQSQALRSDLAEQLRVLRNASEVRQGKVMISGLERAEILSALENAAKLIDSLPTEKRRGT